MISFVITPYVAFSETQQKVRYVTSEKIW